MNSISPFKAPMMHAKLAVRGIMLFGLIGVASSLLAQDSTGGSSEVVVDMSDSVELDEQGGVLDADLIADAPSNQELQQMLAPIALYPDTVLAHILIAATYPLEVVQAQRWVEAHPELEAEEALQAAEKEDWDPSVKALVPFPQLLANMNRDLSWTQNLGEAFLVDEGRVMDAIQQLRQQAYDEGNLESLEHLDVSREKETIVIEPKVREVVYVPYYDARYAYGHWLWHDYPPVYWHYPSAYYRVGSHHRLYWGPRVHVSAGFFFSSFHWHSHRLVVIDYNHRYNNVHFGYQVARHHKARHWQHNPRHRRGVVYRNPRTRDYFERRKYSANKDRTSAVRAKKIDTNFTKDYSRSQLDRRQWGESQRSGFSDRLRNQNLAGRDEKRRNEKEGRSTRQINNKTGNRQLNTRPRPGEISAERSQKKSQTLNQHRAVNSDRQERGEKERFSRDRKIQNDARLNRSAENSRQTTSRASRAADHGEVQQNNRFSTTRNNTSRQQSSQRAKRPSSNSESRMNRNSGRNAERPGRGEVSRDRQVNRSR